MRMMCHGEGSASELGQMAEFRAFKGVLGGVHTSTSSFLQDRDMGLAGRLAPDHSLSLVCLGDLVNIWLLPGHFLHECLQGHTKTTCFQFVLYTIFTSKAMYCMHSTHTVTRVTRKRELQF